MEANCLTGERGKREGGRERETDRQTDKQRERERERERERGREGGREGGKVVHTTLRRDNIVVWCGVPCTLTLLTVLEDLFVIEMFTFIGSL